MLAIVYPMSIVPAAPWLLSGDTLSWVVVHAVVAATVVVVDVEVVEVLVELVVGTDVVLVEVDVVEDDPEAAGLALEHPASTPPTASAPAASMTTRFNNI